MSALKIINNQLFFLTALFCNGIIFAENIYIPTDFDTIQDGINEAQEEDTIIVSPGIYFENINFLGKNIVLTSNFLFSDNYSDIDNTILDGSNFATVVTFNNGEPPTTQIIGFTIQNGAGYEIGIEGNGGGITITHDSFPKINYCIITENQALRGGGIYIQQADPTIHNCIIYRNHVTGDIADNFGGGIWAGLSNFYFKNLIIHKNTTGRTGGGIALRLCQGTIENVLIYGNYAVHVAGGIDFSSCITQVDHVTISNNTTTNGGGAIQSYYPDSHPFVQNSIFWGNYTNEVLIGAGGNLTIDYSIVKNGSWMGDNVLSEDPLFINPIIGDYSLSENSPGIDYGNPNSPLDPDGTITDIGFQFFGFGDPCLDNIQFDVNFDGSVNILDVLAIIDCLINELCPNPTSCEYLLMDCNNDGSLDILDIVFLVEFILEN